MIRTLIGRVGLCYALSAVRHRGKFRILRFMDTLCGPFLIEKKDEQIHLAVFLSSSMDTSYFRRNHRSKGELDIETPALIRALKPGDVFVDIGANIGYLSILAAKQVGPSGLVLAFEPSAREYRRLLLNLEANAISNVVPLQAALSDSAGLAVFDLAPFHTGLNRLEGACEPGGRKVNVPVLDGAILGQLLGNRQPALLKIDVEGAEVRVLRGLQHYLSVRKLPTIVVEVTPRFLRDFGSSREDLYALMNELGYSATVNSNAEQFDEVFVRAH